MSKITSDESAGPIFVELGQIERPVLLRKSVIAYLLAHGWRNDSLKEDRYINSLFNARIYLPDPLDAHILSIALNVLQHAEHRLISSIYDDMAKMATN